MIGKTGLLNRINDLSSLILTSSYFKYVSFIIVIFVIIRWLYYIDSYAVNLLVLDEWDLYVPYFNDYSLVKTFLHQHGPHRQGLGGLIIDLNNNLTHWNNRILGFVNFFIILISPIIYLLIKKKQFKELRPIDSIIFLFALLPSQFAIFINVPNTAHGPMPALLITLFCISLFIKNLYLRNTMLILVNFSMVFTGFAFFIGIITPFLFLGETLWFWIHRDYQKIIISLVSILLTLLTIYLFFQNYRTDAPSSRVIFPQSQPWDYLFYVALSYAYLIGFQGINSINIIIGLMILLPIIYIIIRQVMFLLNHSFISNDPRILLSKIIIILISYSLMFIIGSSIGRLHAGMHLAQSSRYMPYLIPSIIAIFIYTYSLNIKYKSLLLIVLFAIAITGSLTTGKILHKVQQISRKKTEWKEAYLRSENFNEADKITGYKIYPKPERTKLQEKLNYLKFNELNLYYDVRIKE